MAVVTWTSSSISSTWNRKSSCSACFWACRRSFLSLTIMSANDIFDALIDSPHRRFLGTSLQTATVHQVQSAGKLVRRIGLKFLTLRGRPSSLKTCKSSELTGRPTMTSLVWMLLTIPSAAAAEEVVRFDFETGDLQGWQVVEGQFDYLVSDRPMFHNRYPDQPGNQYNKQGKYYLSTVEQQPGKPSNDRMTGVIESPVFVLAGPEMSMLVGSGTQPGTYVALCTLDGKEVLVARGKDQTEVMQRVRVERAATGRAEGLPAGRRPRDRRLGARDVRRLHRPRPDRRRGDAAAVRRDRSPAGAAAARDGDPRVQPAGPAAGDRGSDGDASATEYPRGPEFLARLDALEKRLADGHAGADAAGIVAGVGSRCGARP